MNQSAARPRWAAGTAAGIAAAALAYFVRTNEGWSALGSLLQSGAWGSFAFFVVASNRASGMRRSQAGRRRLTRAQRLVFRRAWRAKVLPDDHSVRTALVSFASRAVEPKPLQTAQLWVMGAWTIFGLVALFVALIRGDATHVLRWAAFSSLPALGVAAVLLEYRLRATAHQLLNTLEPADDSEPTDEAWHWSPSD